MTENKENKEDELFDSSQSDQIRDLLKETVVPHKSYFRLLFVFSCIMFLMAISAVAGIIVINTNTQRSLNNADAIQRVKCELTASLSLRLGIDNTNNSKNEDLKRKYLVPPSERSKLLSLYTIAIRRVLTKKELKLEKEILEKISKEPQIITSKCYKILAK